MPLIDCHSHFDDPRLDVDRQQAYQRAIDAGVNQQIIPAISRRFWPRVKQTVEQYNGLYACYGLHPMFLHHHQTNDLQELETWLKNENPVAVGECGLDYFIKGSDKPSQQMYFEQQLYLAKQFNLPVVIHARGAVQDVILAIKKSQHFNGMLHSFNGSFQQAIQLLDLGYKLSFGGAITYDRALKLRRLIKDLPLDGLLLETDAPDQAPQNNHKLRNEPAYLLDILATVCEIRSETKEHIITQTSANVIKLFRLPSQ